jgi:hypothetical protein
VRGERAGRAEVVGDVAVAIIERVVNSGMGAGVDLVGEKSADSAGAAQGFGEIEASRLPMPS